MNTLEYEVTGRVARITLNRPDRANAITLAMPGELADCVEAANLDPSVHVIALAGAGKGFCGGYDLVEYAETEAPNHDPGEPWDPVVDWQMMSRNLRGFMSLFHSDKPVVCKVHGFCVAGGTDLALCSDLLVIADDARIGYPPARVWGVPTSALWAFRVGDQRAKRLLFTGDLIDGRTAHEWGLAVEAHPAAELDDRFEELVERIALTPVNQLVMMKLLVTRRCSHRACRRLRRSGCSSTASRGTPRRATNSSAARPRRASRRPSATATGPTETSGPASRGS